MKIFGINFVTKRELRLANEALIDSNIDLTIELEACEDALADVYDKFPLDLGQVVYDVALKNSKGRYTKTNPSFEHCAITEVIVDEKNYFGLVERLNRNDVFIEYDDAVAHLETICNK